MQCSIVVFRGISHEQLVFSRYTQALQSKTNAYTEKIQVARGIVHDISRESADNYFIPCHKITVDSRIKATCARRMMGRLDVISSNIQRLSCVLIGRIFYGVAYKKKRLISVNTRAVKLAGLILLYNPLKFKAVFVINFFCHLSPSTPNFTNDFISTRFAFDLSQKFQTVPREQKSFPNPSYTQ